MKIAHNSWHVLIKSPTKMAAVDSRFADITLVVS